MVGPLKQISDINTLRFLDEEEPISLIITPTGHQDQYIVAEDSPYGVSGLQVMSSFEIANKYGFNVESTKPKNNKNGYGRSKRKRKSGSGSHRDYFEH